MENQPNQPQKGGNKALWIVLAIVILAVIGYSIYAYVSNNVNDANNTNTASNVNQTVNTNTAANANSAANTNSNANSVVNGNTNSTTNANIDTSEWKTYENSEYGLAISYPSDWQIFEQEKFCTKIPATDCTNELVSFSVPQGSKSRIAINYRGENPNNLSINEWRKETSINAGAGGTSFDLEYSVPMGDYIGYSSEMLSTKQYQSMTIIYFSLGDKVFDVYWYDQEKVDETGFATFISTLAKFKKI